MPVLRPWTYIYVGSKLQALVYDILPSTTAVFSYAIGSRKLSANEQFLLLLLLIIIIIMYIYHVLINALSAHMIHINPSVA